MMDRKHFMYLSGAGIASLFASDIFAGYKASFRELPLPPNVLSFPTKVSIRQDDGIHELKNAGNNRWTNGDDYVKISGTDNALKVSAGSPLKALHNIVLEWKYNTPAKSKILGDHLERSYGDLQFLAAESYRKMPWYFIQYNGHETFCVGVKTGSNTLCFWQVGEGAMKLTLDTRNGGSGVLLETRELNAAQIVATKNLSKENCFATGRRFCGLMCDKPLLPELPIYGINDWYITYGANSAEIILDHTTRMSQFASNSSNPPFSVVDSGWAYYSPLLPNDCCWQDDFSRPNEHFKDMASLADNIKKSGMRPGLWTRPLCAAHSDPAQLLLPKIPGRDNPKHPVLDPSIAENLARVHNNISIYRDWGFDLVKHDFTTYDMLGKWGNKMADDITTTGWNFNDKTKTTAEIINNLYRTIREAAGPMYLLGCNTISHLSAGVFEINRIGDDTSGKEWERTKTMGVNTLGFRMIQHERFYAADGDCVGLTNAIPWEKNKQWLQLLSESGTPLFISAQKEATGKAQQIAIQQAFSVASKKIPVGEPLDWIENIRPAKWKLNGKTVLFNWE